MPELVVDQVSISLALVGGYISTVGLITYLAKERLYLSEPLMALLFGIIGTSPRPKSMRPDLLLSN